MTHSLSGLSAVLVAVLATGCIGSRHAIPKNPPVGDRSKGTGKELAAAGSTREPALADPSTMIPPRPDMRFPEIPAAPGKETDIVGAPTPIPEKPGGVVPADGIRPVPGTKDVQPAGGETNSQALHRLHERAVERFAKLDGFECKLTRRETVSGRPMPEEVLQYKFRRQPYSVHIKWVGLEGQGRELVYVAGKYDGKVQVLTGRGEGLLVRPGQRFSFAPTDPMIRSKSRHDIREGGMGTSIQWFGKVLAEMDRHPDQANRMRYLGTKPRIERQSGLEAVEETIPADWEPLLPKGGKRTTYFDPDSGSPSYGLPILVVTLADNGREVEYYWFDQLKPITPTDADFDAERLWRR
jgi:hypothetical protein